MSQIKQVIKKSELLKLQEEGLTRKEIADKYEVTDQEMKKYFLVLKIKTKARKRLKFDVLDDTIVSNEVQGELQGELLSTPSNLEVA